MISTKVVTNRYLLRKLQKQKGKLEKLLQDSIKLKNINVIYYVYTPTKALRTEDYYENNTDKTANSKNF